MGGGSARPPVDRREIQFTVGAGVREPVGHLMSLAVGDGDPVAAVRDALAGMEPAVEAWVAAGVFEGNHRGKDRWLACDLLGVDVDYQDASGAHAQVPDEAATRAERLFAGRRLPGSLAHLTPRGFRVFFVLEEREEDGSAALAALKGSGVLVGGALAEAGLLAAEGTPGFAVDVATLELARIVYTPNSIVDGVPRDGEVIVLREECYSAAELAAERPVGKKSAKKRRRSRRSAAGTGAAGGPVSAFREAAERWNEDHPIVDLPRNGGECPLCLHDGCFGELPDRPGHWACFSANHQADSADQSQLGAACGKEMRDFEGSGFGDALDIEAWERGVSPAEVLWSDGYLQRPEDVLGDQRGNAEYRRPRILVRAGELRDTITQAEDALIAADHLPPVFQRGDQLVRTVEFDDPTQPRRGVELPAHTPVLVRIQPVYLQSLFEESAEFCKLNRNGEPCRTRCPADVVAGYQQSAGLWRVPILRGLVQAPTMRADGTVLQVPGYDPDSRLVYDPAGVDFPVIPDAPSLEDARRAIETMLEPVAHFAFVAPSDRTVWLAALLTPFVRAFLPAAPMFVFDAPVRGAGKGKLVNLISTVATGGWPATMTFVDDGDEQRKRIFALLMQGTPIINLDNLDRPLDGATLCTVLTEPTFEERILGESKTGRVPTTATWLATGNNVVIVGDLTRRVLLCRIDPAVERPEERRFPFEPIELAQRSRPQLVAAVLTLLRAHAVAGWPQADLAPFGSFEAWSRVVRAALVWAGEEDPLLGRQPVLAADSEQDLFRVFISSWSELYGDKPMSVRAALAGAHERGCEAAEALRVTAEELTEETDSARQRRLMGLRIAKSAGRVVAGLRFVAGTMSAGTKRWRVQGVGGGQPQ